MFRSIMVPVDLARAENLNRALDCAAELAKAHDAKVTYVGVTTSQPSTVARNPDEFDAKVAAFAAAQGKSRDIQVDHCCVNCHDPTIDLGETLVSTANYLEADLIVMASHVPGFPDHFFTGNGAHVAAHAGKSVFLVR
jgi:nucleotide-binding universal stress UspA family protein